MKSFSPLFKFTALFKGLLLFFIFFFFPIFTAQFISIFIHKSLNIEISEIYLILIQYFIVIILFIILHFSPFHCRYFFRKKTIFQFDKIIYTSIIAFLIGTGVTFLFINITINLPYLSPGIKNWIIQPNQGLVEFFLVIEKKQVMIIFTWIIIITLLTPFTEELIFRGFLFESINRLLLPKFKKWNIDTIFVTLVFSFFHFASLSNVIYALIVGWIITVVRKKSRSLIPCILLHSLINLYGLLLGTIAYFLNQ
ncbi:MAG: CPBP family intramembrane metalloprotease [Spirochaetes bacterium]|nr:CPBP family intramembrane metalloprotease [Spirochaetota bacterium]